MEHERARPAMRVLGAVLTCLLAATLVVAAQRPQGHPHTIRASVAAVSMADTGHANARADHDAAPSRSPSLAVAIAYAAAPAGIGAAPTERLAGSGPVRGPPGEARG